MIETQLSDKRKEFNITDSAFACVVFILFNFIFLLIYRFIPVNVRANRFVYYAASFLIEFLFAAAAWTVAKTRKVDLIPASAMNKKINGKIVGYGFLISVVCLIFFASLTNVFVNFLYVCGYSSVLPDFKFGNFWTYLIYVIISCIAPALFEELLFRGVIESGFKKYGEKIAIVLSAFIFMIMHGNAEQTVHQFIIGLVIGYIFIKSGNLWLGVIIHFFNNFISITEAFILEMLSSSSSSGTSVITQEVAAVESITVNPWLVIFVQLIVALVWAYVGFRLVRVLMAKITDESGRINSPALIEGEANGENSVISVDGEEQAVRVEISETTTGENYSAEEKQNKKETSEKPRLSVPCIIMFALSGLYLFAEWLLSLLEGFGI